MSTPLRLLESWVQLGLPSTSDIQEEGQQRPQRQSVLQHGMFNERQRQVSLVPEREELGEMLLLSATTESEVLCRLGQALLRNVQG